MSQLLFDIGMFVLVVLFIAVCGLPLVLLTSCGKDTLTVTPAARNCFTNPSGGLTCPAVSPSP